MMQIATGAMMLLAFVSGAIVALVGVGRGRACVGGPVVAPAKKKRQCVPDSRENELDMLAEQDRKAGVGLDDDDSDEDDL